MASPTNKPGIGSILEPFTRFTILTPEELDWLEKYSRPGTATVKNGVAYEVPMTAENVAMADAIAAKLPIRRRWRRTDRFGNSWDTRRDRATHFNLTCRLEETLKRQ